MILAANRIHDIARKYVDKCMAEKELLIAKFILENPDIPMDQIEIVEQRTQDGFKISIQLKEQSDG